MLVRRPHLLGRTEPHPCNEPDQGKQLLLPEHQASFLIILLFMLKCPDRRRESWRSQMKHRFNQDSCWPSFKKSFNSMTDVPPGNLFFSPPPFPFPLPFPLSFSFFLLPPYTNNGKVFPEWVNALCHAVTCQPLYRGCLFSSLLVSGNHLILSQTELLLWDWAWALMLYPRAATWP